MPLAQRHVYLLQCLLHCLYYCYHCYSYRSSLMLFFFGVSEGGVVVERWRNQQKVGFVVNRGVATSETGLPGPMIHGSAAGRDDVS